MLVGILLLLAGIGVMAGLLRIRGSSIDQRYDGAGSLAIVLRRALLLFGAALTIRGFMG